MVYEQKTLQKVNAKVRWNRVGFENSFIVCRGSSINRFRDNYVNIQFSSEFLPAKTIFTGLL